MPSIWRYRNIQFHEIIVGQFNDAGIARRIVRAIKDRIHDGSYRPGDKLPSTRAFASEWGASRTTVTAAYGQLIAEGYLATRPGARAIVAAGLEKPNASKRLPASGSPRLSAFGSRLLAQSRPAIVAAPHIADFRYGDLSASDFPVLAWRRALNAASLRRRTPLRYGNPQGGEELRCALQGYLWRSRGIRCTADDLLIVNGSQQGLDLAARLLLDPGDPVVIENPGYALARQAFAAAGGTVLPVPVDADGLMTEALPAARLAYVTPSHQYPLGSVLSAARRRALISWASRHAAYVVEDDYDSEYRHDVAPIPSLQTLAPESVIYAGTFSKTLSPTLRLGYLVVPAALREAFCEAKRLTDRHTPLAEQEALADLLSNGTYERHVRGMRRRNAERRTVLLRALADHLGSQIEVVGSEAGLHVVVWLKGIATECEAAIASEARTAGIGLYPIAALYDPDGPRPAAAGFVLGYAGPDTEALRRGIATFAAVISEARWLAAGR